MAVRSRKTGPEAEFVAPTFLGYSMPAEWLPHEATWVAWPHYGEEWPRKFETVPWAFVEIIRLLAQGERVHVFVEPSRGGSFAKDVRERLHQGDVNLAHVSFHVQPTDRIWVRDSGPIFV